MSDDALHGAADGGGGPRSELDAKLERYFLDPEAGRLDELVAGDDGEEALRLLALDRFVEEGFALLERDGAAMALTDVAIGRRIDCYRLLQQIAVGGMGVLYLAEDLELGRLVAVKLLARSTEATSKRFQREAAIAASLSHPNIVPVYGRGEADGVHYIVMRYVAGDDIERTLSLGRATGRSAAQALYDRAARLCVKVTDALQAAHDAGIIHRDLKPSNILVEGDEPFVVDFGLATHEGDQSITQAGDRLGTVPYMSPEQIRGEVDALDHRTDVYSLGVTLYQLLTGAVPFAGRSPENIARQILERDPAGLGRHGVPRDLEAIVLKAMEKERGRRYASARELGDDLRRFLERLPVRARRLGALRRLGRRALRRKRVVAVALLGAVAVVAFGVFYWRVRVDRRETAERQVRTAEALASRGLYDEACRVLEPMLDDGAFDVADRHEVYLRHDLYDRLMELLNISEDGLHRTHADLPFEEIDQLLARAAASPRGDVLPDRFRQIRIFVLARRGRLQDAQAEVGDWERELGGARRRTIALRSALAVLADGAARDRVEADIRRQPATDASDHFFAAMTLAWIDGAEAFGLAEIAIHLDAHPNDYWARFVCGNLLRRLTRLEEAREVYSGIIASLAPEGAGRTTTGETGRKARAAYYQRALLEVSLGDSEAALRDFARAGDVAGSWRLALNVAECLRRSGRLPEALASYRETGAELHRQLDELDREPETPRRRARSTTLTLALERVSGGFLHALAASHRWDEAAAVMDSVRHRIGAATALRMRLELELERATIEAARGGGAASLEDVLEDIEDLAAAEDADDRVGFLRALALERLGRVEDATAVLGAILEHDPSHVEARYRRAWLLFDRIHGAKLERFRVEHAGLSTDARGDEGRLAGLIATAVDDLGTIAALGFRGLTRTQERDVVRFLHGVLRVWSGEPSTASVILGDLAQGAALNGFAWGHLVHLFHGRALEETGRAVASLAAYERALAGNPSEPWGLAWAGRLAATHGDAATLRRILALMREHAPEPGWMATEVARPEYRAVRADPRFEPSFR